MRIGILELLFILFGVSVTMIGCSGAVSSHEIMPNIKSVSNEYKSSIDPISMSQQNFHINSMPEKYSYENLLTDIQKLQNENTDKLQCIKLCDTADGRGVYDIILGNPNGNKQILILGAMHAREYITTQIVMRQLCDAIDVLNGVVETSSYSGINKKYLLENVTIHFIPMNNPDGVSISQFGLAGIRNTDLRQKISAMYSGDYAQWKANAVGVDLNRNFEADWQEFGGSRYPAAERYKGAYPGSEPETAALIELTERFHIQRAISYHTCGALIYWYYKQQGDVLAESQRFAQRISAETGYPLDNDYTAVDAAGYKDWAVYRMGIPAITIETGAENGRSIINPVPISRFSDIWERNKNIVYATAYDLL